MRASAVFSSRIGIEVPDSIDEYDGVDMLCTGLRGVMVDGPTQERRRAEVDQWRWVTEQAWTVDMLMQ